MCVCVCGRVSWSCWNPARASQWNVPSATCTVSWPSRTFLSLPAPSTLLNLSRRRICRRAAYYGSVFAWVRCDYIVIYRLVASVLTFCAVWKILELCRYRYVVTCAQLPLVLCVTVSSVGTNTACSPYPMACQRPPVRSCR